MARVLLFGSRARGDYRLGSDIALLVVGDRTPAVANACRQAAARVARNVYTDPPAVDVTVLDTDHFDFMQHGLNHVAAHAAREGVTLRGERYKPPKPSPDHLPESHRREAMERAAYARDNLLFLEGTIQRGMSQPGIPFNWDRFLGMPKGHWNTRSRPYLRPTVASTNTPTSFRNCWKQHRLACPT